MLVVPDGQPSKQSPDDEARHEANPDEPPPTYSPPTEAIASGSNASPFSPVPTFRRKPTNFLVLSNHQDSIRGEFVIDPSIRIPSSMLLPLGENETEDDRKNLSLRSEFGSVHTDIWLLGSQTKPGRRTTVVLTSIHGSIHSQLRTVDLVPFALSATTIHGSVKLDIPRAFTGLLVLATVHGGVKLSDPLLQHATQLSQHGDSRRYFIGDFALFGEEWEGDRIEAETVHGSIRVRYVDEGEEQIKKKGLLSRLFGM